MQALLELDRIPAGMELFPAANEEQWELVKSVIDQSDYYIVIVGGRYGSLTADGLSYTEREYDYAVEREIPIAGFVFANPDALPRGKSELDPGLWTKLEAFRAKVQSRMVKFYTDPASLGGVVSRSMVAQMKRHPRPGWVRGEFAMTAEVREEIGELRARLAERERDEAVAASRHTTEPDASLDQGADEVVVDYRYDSRNRFSEPREFQGSWTLTWDEVIERVGPLMIDEASEPAIREGLNNAILSDLLALEDTPRLREPRMAIDDAAWGRVLVQLRALGYVELGVKKRTVSDRSTYWKLTRSGDDRLVWLLAARREQQAGN